MVVKELKEKLEQYPEDLDVKILHDYIKINVEEVYADTEEEEQYLVLE